jgi:hypothetical protein
MKIKLIERELIKASIKMSWHGIHYSTHGRAGIHTNFSSENMQGINHFIKKLRGLSP